MQRINMIMIYNWDKNLKKEMVSSWRLYNNNKKKHWFDVFSPKDAYLLPLHLSQ